MNGKAIVVVSKPALAKAFGFADGANIDVSESVGFCSDQIAMRNRDDPNWSVKFFDLDKIAATLALPNDTEVLAVNSQINSLIDGAIFLRVQHPSLNKAIPGNRLCEFNLNEFADRVAEMTKGE